MAFNLSDELGKLTTKLTDTVSAKAKDSAISTLNDPEFKATVNKFTKDWFDEHSYILVPLILSFAVLSILAIANIISNFRATK